MQVILISIGLHKGSKDPAETIKVGLPRENLEDCPESPETFKFRLPFEDLHVDTRFKSLKENAQQRIQGFKA